MNIRPLKHKLALACLAIVLAGCGSQQSFLSPAGTTDIYEGDSQRDREYAGETSIFDAFNRESEERIVAVNRYLWAASFEVLNFLPVESVDPFTGVIVTGFGTPPGSSRAYRATVLIDDPALDARSLNLSLQTRNGPASSSAVRAVENAILSRARQLRIADDKL